MVTPPPMGGAPAPGDTNSRMRTVEPFLDPRKSLACIHCGLCLSSCPTYLETGDENNSPRGRIHLMKALQDGRLEISSEPVRHIDLCLGCRACEAACPSGVEYGVLLEATREFVERHHRRSLWQRFLRKVAIERIFPFPARMRLALLPVQWIRRFGLAGLLPKFVRDTLALIPSRISRGVLPALSPAVGTARGRVGFIRGCVMNVMFGATNEASIRLLNAAGFDVVTPSGQGCCGALYAHGGNLEDARASARRNLDAFDEHQLDAVIINAAGCGSTLKEYAHLLEKDPVWHDRAMRFSAAVKDLTEWLAQKGMTPSGGPLGQEADGSGPTVTFHDACHLAHAQKITHPPRQLLKGFAGRGFVELPESDVCCGSAGSYNLTEPEMAERLQHRKIKNILASGASIVVSTNPGCLLQIRAGLDKAGARHIQTLHIADYLDQFASARPAERL
jgi:glycolate oxidase iron-sulfur subunit